MSPFAVKAIQLLLSLSLLIVLHELGHYIPAKIFKTRVEKFYLFFDVKFSLFKKKIGETVYGIGWLPLGGYVKIAGMIDESMDKDQMAGPPQPWEFRSKPAWQRLIIMLGGVTVNIIVGLVIYMGILYFYGRSITTNEDLPHGLAVTEQLKSSGFRDGDYVLRVDGKEVLDGLEVNRLIMLRNVQTVEVRHSDGTVETLSLPENIEMDLFKVGVMIPFEPRREATVDSVIENGPSDRAGFKVGDKVVSVNGQASEFWDEYKTLLDKNGKNENTIVVSRNNQLDTLRVTPDENGMIGIVNYPRGITQTKIDYTLAESIPAGASYGYNKLVDYAKQFKFVFTKEGATQVGGFGAIGNLFPSKWNWPVFWEMTALISIILAFMNILPIPALDGGHVMFLLYEIVSGRKPNDKFMEYAQMVGFFILIALVLFANGNDIYRWLFE
ncbi:MAG TPA: RIP metalloprotease RseP [Aequorivita sp.]|nr:RIP metalloprotease RseP [Aequorivita sp.]